ncbi:MAG: SDR family NAD(P)-dependent oxidoreductase [Burkholderiales bacterium]
MSDKPSALIVGVGKGLSASLARLLAGEGMNVALAARDTTKLAGLIAETGALAITGDASLPEDVNRMFATVEQKWGVPDLVVYNANYRTRGAISGLDPAQVQRTLQVSAFAGFLVGQAAAKRMLPRGTGSIFFTGASASIKGFANSSAFAMGKFALRGLAQSLARELGPQGIHVAHFVIDGGIRSSPSDTRGADRGPDGLLLPDEIAQSYLHVHRQQRSAWSWEIDLRPWAEKF